ncbi:MAG: sulfite exporter TauE/SafE family protein [Pseudomonadota bacterium]
MIEAGLIYGALGLAFGGILKGATGAGAPLLAVPLLTLFYGVETAVAVFTVPGVLANLFQVVRFRKSLGDLSFVGLLAGMGAVGAAIGSVLLVLLPTQTLIGTISILVYVYVAFRLARPTWALSERWAMYLAAPAGFTAGVLQGAAGLSAPVSITFLNAMRLPRPRFIAVISVFFGSMAVVQIPSLAAVGIMTPQMLLFSLAACLPLFGAMPLGAFLARHVSSETFDKVVLLVLLAVATRLLIGAFFF